MPKKLCATEIFNVKKTFVFLLFIFLYCFSVYSQGHNISVEIKGYANKTVYLGNYYGDKQYISDTLKTDSNGKFKIIGEKNLEGGIYFILNTEKTILFEFLVSEQKFSLSTDSIDFKNNLKVKHSKENEIFFDFNRFYAEKRKTFMEYEKRIETNKNNPDSVTAIKSLLKSTEKEIQDYIENTIKNYPDALISKIFNINKSVEIPESPDKSDSTFALRYHQQHFFDLTDFSDPRLLHTPALNSKIYTYLDRLVYPEPDSLKKAAEMICEKAKANKDVFRYCLSNLTYHFITSNFMWMDEVFLHLYDKYFLTGEATWADTSVLNEYKKIADRIRYNQKGMVAYNLNYIDTSRTKIYPLHNIKTDFTIVFFFDPGCGHCKSSTAALNADYNTLRMMGAEVYAVCTKPEHDKWTKFIRDNKLKWINVGPTDMKYKDMFNVYTAPIIYILDKEKRIIAKKLDAAMVKEFILNYNHGL